MKKTLFVILLTAALLLCGMSVSAMNTGFTMEEIRAEVRDELPSKLSISLLTVEPKNYAVDCFDVNDDGMLAVGTGNLFTERTIAVYSPDGAFQYGYRFENFGSFHVDWDEENIIIYLVRSDIAVSVNPSGEIEEMLKIADTMENDTYWNTITKRKRTVNDIVYKSVTDGGIWSKLWARPSIIAAIDPTGEVSVVYDKSSELNSRIAIFAGLAALFVCIAVIRIVLRFTKKKRNK